MKTILSNVDTFKRAKKTAQNIMSLFPERPLYLYPVSHGGIPAAYAILNFLPERAFLVPDPDDANIFIDDVIDSGRTRKNWSNDYPGRFFFALVDKQGDDKNLGWIVFPWEDGCDGTVKEKRKILTSTLPCCEKCPAVYTTKKELKIVTTLGSIDQWPGYLENEAKYYEYEKLKQDIFGAAEVIRQLLKRLEEDRLNGLYTPRI